MQRINLERLFKNRSGLVELLQFLIAEAFEVVGVRVSRIECRDVFEAGERSFSFISAMLHEAKVVPRLRTVGIDRDRLLEQLLAFVQTLQSQQCDSLIHGGLRKFRILS